MNARAESARTYGRAIYKCEPFMKRRSLLKWLGLGMRAFSAASDRFGG